MFCRINLVKFSGDKDALALRHGLRFDNKICCRIGITVRFQIFKLVREKPSFRKELIIIWKLLLHFIQVPGQVIFPCNLIHARKVVDLLKRLHLLPPLQARCDIRPLDIPFNICIPRIPMAELPTEILFAYFLNNIIYCIEYIENNTHRFLLLHSCVFFLALFLFLSFFRLLWGGCLNS